MSAARSPRTGARKQSKTPPEGKATAAKTAPADPDKLVRSAAGRYTSADERFTVESDASGTWYVIDQVRKDDFGLPRLLGPHRTLAAARQAIRFARGK
jgi:hypothetical protein